MLGEHAGSASIGKRPRFPEVEGQICVTGDVHVDPALESVPPGTEVKLQVPRGRQPSRGPKTPTVDQPDPDLPVQDSERFAQTFGKQTAANDRESLPIDEGP